EMVLHRIWELVGGDGAGLEACLFGGTEVGERAPTELIGWDGVFCPNRLGGCYKLAVGASPSLA
ncbi:MAG: hypothetical protein RLZZ338_1746, partial [Cyanobacteriota bacterium]